MSRPLAVSRQCLVDVVALSESTLNLLFAALLLAASGGFIVGNLLLLDSLVFQRSGRIALACLALLSIFYTLTRSLGNVTWGLVITYVLILGMAYGRQPWSITLVYACAAWGLLYTLRFLRVARRHWGSMLLMGVMGTVTAVISGWISMTAFDMLHRLHVPGGVQSDTLFFAGISAMIKHYGVVSTGLHGLVETSYHVLSHALMAGLSLLSDTGAIEVYGVAPSVLFVSILIFSVVACSAMLEWEKREKQSSVPVAWGLTCILLIGVPILLGRWLSSGYFISESYLVSLGLFLLGLPLLFKARLAIPDLFSILLVAALIADAKVSGGLIYAGFWLTRLLFVPGERLLFERIATLAALVAVAFVTVKPIAAMSGSLVLDPLRSISTYLPFGNRLAEAGTAIVAGNEVSWRTLALALLALVGFFVLHFLPSWLLIGGVTALLKDPVALYPLAAVIAGALVVLLFYHLGGAVYFFSNTAFFVALPLIVVFLTRQVDHRRVTNTAALLFGALILNHIWFTGLLFDKPLVRLAWAISSTAEPLGRISAPGAGQLTDQRRAESRSRGGHDEQSGQSLSLQRGTLSISRRIGTAMDRCHPGPDRLLLSAQLVCVRNTVLRIRNQR